MIQKLISLTSLLAICFGQSFEPEDLLPCVYRPVADVNCGGIEITDEVLKRVATKLGSVELNVLTIHSTQLTAIGRNTFPNTVVENIVIQNNSRLTTIDAHAFKQSPAIKNVVIQHNPALTDSANTFAAIKALNPTHGFYLQYTGITEIPAGALAANPVESRLEYMLLDHNKIEKIGANAFAGHGNLAFIDLGSNKINRLESAALNLTYSKYGEHTSMVYVYLNYNNLTSASLPANAFGDMHNAIGLDLEFNHFTDLPESPFRPLLDREGSKLFLYGNNFACANCTLKWTLARVNDNQIRGLYCANLQKSIEGLTEREIGCAA